MIEENLTPQPACYTAPLIEVMEIAIEYGFAASVDEFEDESW